MRIMTKCCRLPSFQWGCAVTIYTHVFVLDELVAVRKGLCTCVY